MSRSPTRWLQMQDLDSEYDIWGGLSDTRMCVFVTEIHLSLRNFNRWPFEVIKREGRMCNDYVIAYFLDGEYIYKLSDDKGLSPDWLQKQFELPIGEYALASLLSPSLPSSPSLPLLPSLISTAHFAPPTNTSHYCIYRCRDTPQTQRGFCVADLDSPAHGFWVLKYMSHSFSWLIAKWL